MLIQLSMVAAYIIAFMLISRLLKPAIVRIGLLKEVGALRQKRVTRTLQIGLLILTVMATSLTLGWGYSQIGVFLSSIFAILGVALFAQWSILSNVTASLLIFFAFPYRVGDLVKVVDKDEDISGIIEEISMFHVIIIRADGELISYPNNLILQKAVIKLQPVSRLPDNAATESPPAAPATPAKKTALQANRAQPPEQPDADS